MAREAGGEKAYELLLPFSLYHSRWNVLEREDFRPHANRLYGAELRYGVSIPGDEIITDAGDKKAIDEEKLFYLDRVKQIRQSNEIQLVLINIPYSYLPEWQREANSFYEYAEENRLCYVNDMNENVGIDFDIDFYDQGHLNPAGMRKMTDELGKLLNELGAKDRRNEAQAREWMEEYKEYIRYRIEMLQSVTDANIYLMSLYDPDLVSVIQVRRSVLKDAQIRKLTEQLDNGENRIWKPRFAVLALCGRRR